MVDRQRSGVELPSSLVASVLPVSSNFFLDFVLMLVIRYHQFHMGSGRFTRFSGTRGAINVLFSGGPLSDVPSSIQNTRTLFLRLPRPFWSIFASLRRPSDSPLF